MALDTDAAVESALVADATDVTETMVEMDADAVLVTPVKAEEKDSEAEDAALLSTEETASVEETAAEDDAPTAEESSLD